MHLGSVIGKFKLERRLGHGAMGDVFLGVHVELGSFVAIKILNAAACAEPNGVARFLNEAKKIERYTAESFRGCREKPLPKVKCSLSDAFRQAKADGLQDAGKAMEISWLADGWYFDLGDPNGSMSVCCP